MQGLFGIASERDCLDNLYSGTFALQSRGQLYGGLATYNGERIKIRTHRGLFGITFKSDLEGMEGTLGIGVASGVDRQPIYRDSRLGEYIIGLDGYIMNSDELRMSLSGQGISFTTKDDVEIIACLIGKEDTFEEGLEKTLKKVVGPCAIVMLTKQGIYAARGISGFLPLAIGKKKGAWAVASESCAFNGRTKLHKERDVAPGEIVKITSEGVKTLKKLEGKVNICSFQWIYFARPNSDIDGTHVTDVRHNLGRFLAEDDNIEADIVAPVPFSGIMHAEGYHLGSGLPLLQVFLLPQYILRTYNLPIEMRKKEKNMKLEPIVPNVKGKSIVLVDDSIRAGITMKGMVDDLFSAGAREVHVRIGSPVSTCYCPYDRRPVYEEEFIAAKNTIEEVRQFIGATTLRYQRLVNVAKSIGKPESELCLDCFK